MAKLKEDERMTVYKTWKIQVLFFSLKEPLPEEGGTIALR